MDLVAWIEVNFDSAMEDTGVQFQVPQFCCGQYDPVYALLFDVCSEIHENGMRTGRKL
jgi:hypothetical protein